MAMTMTHSYIIEGMTCQGCAAKVKSKLLTHPEVISADIDLAARHATISMQKHLTVDELQRAIGVDTKYRIAEDKMDMSHHSMSKVLEKSWVETYKPLLIIGAFILLVSWITSNGNLHHGMMYFMAGFFLVFSFFKLLDLKGFAESYAMYDILAMRVPAYGYLYPFLELALGLAYLTGFDPQITNWATVGLMGFSSLGVIRSVVNKQQIRCACLGAVFNLPMSTVTIVEDLLMVAMAVAMIVW